MTFGHSTLLDEHPDVPRLLLQGAFLGEIRHVAYCFQGPTSHLHKVGAATSWAHGDALLRRDGIFPSRFPLTVRIHTIFQSLIYVLSYRSVSIHFWVI